jgi:hypothetical protein
MRAVVTIVGRVDHSGDHRHCRRAHHGNAFDDVEHGSEPPRRADYPVNQQVCASSAARASFRLDDLSVVRRLRSVAQLQIVDDLGVREVFVHDGEDRLSTLRAGDFAADQDTPVDALDAYAELIGPCVVRDGLLDALAGALDAHAAVTFTGIS